MVSTIGWFINEMKIDFRMEDSMIWSHFHYFISLKLGVRIGPKLELFKHRQGTKQICGLYKLVWCSFHLKYAPLSPSFC